MNKASLSHILTGVKIFLAMRAAVKTCTGQTVFNRKGKAFLSVRYLTGDMAWDLLGRSSGFFFADKNGRDVTGLVLNSLKVGA